MVVPMVFFVTSTSGVAPVTVTVSFTDATVSVMSIRGSWPVVSVSPCRTCSTNPASSARTS